MAAEPTVLQDLDDEIDIKQRPDPIEFEDGVLENLSTTEEVEIVEAEPEPEPEPEKPADDLEEYSDAVRKRIMRERKVMLRERQEKEAERQKRIELETKILEYEKQAHQSKVDVDLVKARTELVDARSSGDMEAEAEAIDRIADLRAQRATMPSPPPVEVPPAESSNEARESWLSRNDWYEDERYTVQANAAFEISTRLIAQKKDPRSDEFWNTLDRELAKTVRLPGAPKPTSPVASTRPTTPVKGSKVVITAEDRAAAARFGMDLNDPKQLKAFAIEKQRSGA